MNIPDDLIDLERAAEEARAHLAGLAGEEWEQQRLRWRKASEKVQLAITEYAAATEGVNRYEVEQAVKKTVRHSSEDPAE